MADKEDKKGGFSKEQITMWNRWKQIVNMDASELKRFRGSDDADEVGLDTDQAKRAGVSVQSGHEMSKKIERVIAKAAGHKGFLPPKVWSSDDWEVVGSTINYISRARANKGDLTDDEGNPTPKKLALMLWGRKEKEGSSFPDKDDVKDMVNKKLQETKSMKFGAYLQTLVEAEETGKWTTKQIAIMFDMLAEEDMLSAGPDDDILKTTKEFDIVMKAISKSKTETSMAIENVILSKDQQTAIRKGLSYVKEDFEFIDSFDGKTIFVISFKADFRDAFADAIFKNQNLDEVSKFLKLEMAKIKWERAKI